MDMQDWVKTVGLSILLIGIISIIVSKFRQIDGLDSTANTSLGTGLTLLGDMVDYIEIGVLILIGAYFFSKLSSKTGGFGQ